MTTGDAFLGAQIVNCAPSVKIDGGEVLEDTIAVDAFSPAREDFKTQLGWVD